MNETKRFPILTFLLNIFPILLAFTMPLFFLPITWEFFEFNKLALMTTVVVITTLLWLLQMILTKKVYVIKSPLDPAIFCFYAAVLVSTIFSLHKYSSIFGSYGRWFPSLFGYSVLILAYYVI